MNCFKHHALLALLAVSGLDFFRPVPVAAQRYRATFVGGYGYAIGGSAAGINNAGQVVGSLDGGVVYTYSLASGLHTVAGPYAYAYGINSLGHIVGYSDNGPPTAFFWSADTGQVALTSTAQYSFARGINDSDQIVGDASFHDIVTGLTSPLLAVGWKRNGSAFSLYGFGNAPVGSVNGSSPESTSASGINNDGTAVGYYSSNGSLYNPQQAAIFFNTTPVSTSLLGNPGSLAYAINNNGMVVGVSTVNGNNTATVFGGAGYLLPFLPFSSPFAQSYARAINDLGQIVGDGGGAPVVWNATGVHELNSSIISRDYYVDIGRATGINNLGQICGETGGAGTVPVLLTPVAEDVSSQIQVTRGGFTFNHTTQRFVQTVTIKNTGVRTMVGPFPLVLDNLSSGITLFNASGITATTLPMGHPYINLLIGGLTPGKSASVTLTFIDPAKKAITYSTRVFASSGLP